MIFNILIITTFWKNTHFILQTLLETDYFYDYVMTVIENGMKKEFDGEMFSYLYRKLKK